MEIISIEQKFLGELLEEIIILGETLCMERERQEILGRNSRGKKLFGGDYTS